jgi:hypothetical protein
MTDTNPPADRVAEIRARLMSATMPNPEQKFEKFGKAVTASFVLREHAARDIAFLLYELDKAERALEEQRWYGEQMQMSMDACINDHEIPEYEAGAEEPAPERTTAPDTAMDSFEAADDIYRRWE